MERGAYVSHQVVWDAQWSAMKHGYGYEPNTATPTQLII